MTRVEQSHPLMVTLDWELWQENRHLLPARVRKAVKKGEVAQLSPITEYLPGWCEVYVRRLRPRPSRWRKPLTVAGLALAVAGVALWVTYMIVQVLAVALAPALVILALTSLAFHAASEHGSGCKGWHCPGCRR
jgi:hypothetical protein